MAKQTGGTDLLTLAMRRAHADTADRQAPEHPPDGESGSAADATDDQNVAVDHLGLVDSAAQ